jgi:hypothetical protein
MTDFIEAIAPSPLCPRRGDAVTLAGKEVALFNVDGNIQRGCLSPCWRVARGSGEFNGKIDGCLAHS